MPPTPPSADPWHTKNQRSTGEASIGTIPTSKCVYPVAPARTLERQKWNAKKFGAPFVWRDGSQWIMILMGENSAGRTTFGLLASPDGKRWTPLPE